MRTVGGKKHVARRLAGVIQTIGRACGATHVDDRFCGVLSVSLACHRAGFMPIRSCDGNPALIAMFRAVQRGWSPPRVLTKDEWYRLRERRDLDDPLTAFAGILCSYMGKPWSSLAAVDHRPHKGVYERSAAIMAHDDIERNRHRIESMTFIASDCLDDPLPGALIFADPPYQNGAETDRIYVDAPAFHYVSAWSRLWQLAETVPFLATEYIKPPYGDWVALGHFDVTNSRGFTKNKREVVWTRPDSPAHLAALRHRDSLVALGLMWPAD